MAKRKFVKGKTYEVIPDIGLDGLEVVCTRSSLSASSLLFEAKVVKSDPIEMFPIGYITDWETRIFNEKNTPDKVT